jgi:Glycosyl hydrolase family 30 beta sandwich domain
LTKPYHLFRQWGEPLKPGMRVVETSVTGRSAAGVKPTAFLAPDDRTLVVHIVNAQDKDAPIALKLTGTFAAATSAARSRTSATEDALALTALAGVRGAFADTLPARSMVTYRFDGPGR